MAIDTVLSALSKPRKSGAGAWRARCPACGDKNSTKLSVRECDDGRVLIKCFAGCGIDEVLGAMGLQMTDLFPPRVEGQHFTRGIPGAMKREAIGQLKGDLNVVWIFLNDIATGRPMTDADRAKAGEYGRRVANMLAEVS
jgi:hypothetical protein